MKSSYANSVQGSMNFAADKYDGGQFSNAMPELTRQNLQSVEIEIRNGRSWPRSPTLEQEGLTLVQHPDESLVFVGVDLDPARPLDCAYSAFQHPEPRGTCVPRASIETRVLAIFD